MNPIYSTQAATGMYSLKKLRVVSFQVQTTGTYQQQYVNPYQTVVTPQAKNAILRAVDAPGSSIMSGVVAKIPFEHQIVKPNAVFESPIIIPDGFGTRHLRYVLVVESTDPTGINTYVQHINGWTDHHGVSHGNLIGDDVRFIINNISIARRSKFDSPMGTQVANAMIDNSQVISNNAYQGVGSAPGSKYGMRPDDIFSQIDSNDFAMMTNDDTITCDTRGVLTTQPVKSKRMNSIPAAYTAGLLDAWLQTGRSEDVRTDEQHLSAASVQVESMSMGEDPFMSFLDSRSALGVSRNYFTLNDLRAADPSCEHILRSAYVPMSPTLAMTLATPDNAMTWHGTDGVTQFANSLAQALPGYLTQCNLNKIRFTATNQSINGEVVVLFTELARSFFHADVRPAMANLAMKLKTELLNTLGYGGAMQFSIIGTCDLMGDTDLKISLNNSGEYRWVHPTMMDGLGAPIQTSNAAVVAGTAKSFHTLMELINTNRDRLTPSNPVGSILTSGRV